ncbi:piggyBac transposable element-derived protein 4-like [Macrosteles quadrilineatus]|uniref:piggyBac transposable element-derived protein 4-like n=1 Tax=Macrosteles quadrilineatus TaxID=74068 RepID=UPI0023E21016|nr:piggyBac transposable element-derived protein 4-like [Macrosteles quadrilineatus]
MGDKNLTPRKIEKELGDTLSDGDLSAESEIFDSDKDPEYVPDVLDKGNVCDISEADLEESVDGDLEELVDGDLEELVNDVEVLGDISQSEDEHEENGQQTKQRKQNKKKRQDEYNLNIFGTERKIKWEEWQGRQKKFPFTGQSGINPEVSAKLADGKPIDYFLHLVSEDIINVMVDQTNLYATQVVSCQEDVAPHSRLHGWTPTDAIEIKRFLGLIGWMGLVKLPNLRDYWSKNKIYDLQIPRNTMSRNRFELLLKMWHFADNNFAGTNRLHKIEHVMSLFIENFKQAYTPGETMSIDESQVPWRGRLVFRQYNPRKRHRYGIKLYKLCAGKGYTWNFSVYIGKDACTERSASENVVYKLLGGIQNGGKDIVPGSLLGEGRSLVVVVDNWYASVPLALGLLEHSTHFIGTLRPDRKYLPPAVALNINKGDIMTRETEEGLTCIKWKDKRDVYLLSTVHTNEVVEVTTNSNKVVHKPMSVVLYNEGKYSIDMSDQMATYNKALRRCTKWYRKLMIEVIWGMTVVNSHFLYNCSGNEKMPIKQFREAIVLSLLQEATPTERNVTPRRSRGAHYLIEVITGDPPRKKRGRCKVCYDELGRQGTLGQDGKVRRAKQVYTVCDTCEGQPHMCRPCFNKKH